MVKPPPDPPPTGRKGNPVGSPWRSPPNAARKRPIMGFTLPPGVSERIDDLVAWRRAGSRSELICRLVNEAFEADERAAKKKETK